jgi:alpha-tubulin suppressor-like RCC1 family protein
VTAIAAGGAHSVFIKSDGTLWGMGFNAYGQLGDGTTNNIALPERIYPALQFVITNLTISAGTNLVFQGVNDFSGGTTYVWSGTNLALPVNQWTRIWTNGIGSGNFSFTARNVVSPGAGQHFYRLELFQIQ